MTKHLRFLFIALLMAVWTGGWAQTTVWSENWSKAKANNAPSAVNSAYKASSTNTKVYTTQISAKGPSGSPELLLAKDNNSTLTIDISKLADLKKFTKDFTFSFYSNKSTLTVTANGTNVKMNNGSNANEYVGTFSITNNESLTIVIKNPGKNARIDDLLLTGTLASTKTATTTTFGENSKKAFTFVNGVLEGFKAPTATVTPAEAQSAMEYWSDNENVVKVGTDGALTFGTVFDTEAKIYAGIKDGNATYEASSDYYTVVNTSDLKDPELAFDTESYNIDVNDGKFFSAKHLKNPNSVAVKYAIAPTSDDVEITADGEVTVLATGEYTITAKFAGDNTYKPATAKCKLVVTDGSIETKTVTFVAGVDKGLFTSSGVNKESMTKQNVTIKSTRANFSGTIGKVHDYRFYKSISEEELGETTFSTTLGKITKIEFIESSGDLPSAFETSVGTYDKTNYVWTGEEKNVTFTTKALIRATKIIVTLAVPQAKAYTFDETNDNNIVENYENANVTLKRSNLVTDSWNTFCVPFAISAEEIATTWGEGTELRTFDRMSGNTMYFKKAESIEAGKPYLVKPTNATDGDLTFNGVQTVVMTKAENTVGEKGFYMVGTYNAVKLAEDGSNLFLAAKNEFNRPTIGSAKMKGMRVYFEVPANTKPAELRANIDGVETGINAINGIEGNTTAPVYNLQGQCVGNSLRSLAPGIYVQGGKKYVVK